MEPGISGAGLALDRGLCPEAMQSDDLFVRKIRRHSNRPPLTSLSFDAFRSSKSQGGEGPLAGHCGPPLRSPRRSYLMHRSNSDVTLSEGELAAPSSPLPTAPEAAAENNRNSSGPNSFTKVVAPLRARAHSHEEPRAGSPTARRFRDPLLLLGLAANEVWETEGDAASAGGVGSLNPALSEVPTLVWGRHLAHYDVQSILFEPSEVAREAERPGNITTGASAASQPRLAGAGGLFEGEVGEEKDGPLVLSCPYFRVEAGGETEWGLGQHRGSLAGFHCPNMAVSVLEEPRESYGQRTNRAGHAIEYADLGACYYRKHFYGKGEDLLLRPGGYAGRAKER